jgi:hypothetical protein
MTYFFPFFGWDIWPCALVPATVGATGCPYDPRAVSPMDPVEVMEPPVFGLAIEVPVAGAMYALSDTERGGSRPGLVGGAIPCGA